MSLFKQPRYRAQRVCKVESLNPTECITQSYMVSKDMKRHMVVLCLSHKTVKSVFNNEYSALEQMRKNRELYKELKSK